MRKHCLISLALLTACSAESAPPPNVRLLVGQESETWSADPAPTKLKVEFVSATDRHLIGESSAPTEVITIRNPLVAGGTIGTFEVTGFDATDTAVVRGASVRFEYWRLGSVKIPIFVARAMTWSRPSENLPHGRNRPVTALVGGQFIFASGGQLKDASPTILDVYDSIQWEVVKEPHSLPPVLPRAPQTMMLAGSKLFSIDAMGGSSVDLDNYNKEKDEPPPTGLTYAEIAGGDVFVLPDGSSYVVGATRAEGEPTAKVLRIDRNGLVLRAISMVTPRKGAAAGVVGGNLVVWGGSAVGPGAEALTKAQDAFSALPFPADATTGLGLGAIEGNTVLLAGGKDPATGAAAPWRTADFGCMADCAAAELTAAPMALDRTRVFTLAAGALLVGGESEDGEFHAFSMTPASSPEMTARPLRERRRLASALYLPNGQPGVLGGEDPVTGASILSIESFFF